MGSMRFRRSVKIAPGVRLNVSKTGVGVSAGVKGARVSAHSSGRTTKTVGVPGTGVYWREDKQLGSTRRQGATTSGQRARSNKQAGTDVASVQPRQWSSMREAMSHVDTAGIRSPSVTLLRRAARDADVATLRALVDVEEVHNVAAALCALLATEQGAFRTAAECADAIDLPELTTDPLAAELLVGTVPIAVVPGRSLTVELLAAVPLSLIQALCRAGRYEEVLVATDGMPLEGDLTAAFIVERGRAFVGARRFEAAKDVLAPIVRRTSLSAHVRAHALEVRVLMHLGLNRRAQARKDIERLMAIDSVWPSLTELEALAS